MSEHPLRAVRRALEQSGALDPVPPSSEVEHEEAIRLLHGEVSRPMHTRDLYELRKALDRP
jgi:hypothetical protein